MFLFVNQYCVFWPAFGCCSHLKAGRNTFFQSFSNFFPLFKHVSVNFHLKSLKNVWKNYVLSYSLNAGILPERVRRIVFFRFIFTEKCLKTKKGWKQLKKVFWPAFVYAQHSKACQNTQQMKVQIRIQNEERKRIAEVPILIRMWMFLKLP